MNPETAIALPDLLFEVRGAKAAAFLHGQLTAHIQNLNVGDVTYSFLLNRMGKIQADLHVARLADSFLMMIVPECSEVVITHLQKLSALSQVQIVPWQDKSVVHFLQMPDASKPLLHHFSSFRFFNRGHTAVIANAHKNDFLYASTVAAENYRILSGVPLLGVDFNTDNLPQETGRFDALHFDKGCYLGQEIVTRLEHRGHVNRQLVKIKVALPVLSGSGLTDFEKNPIGRVTSAIFDEASHQTYGLAWLDWKALQEGRAVFYQDAAVSYFAISKQKAAS